MEDGARHLVLVAPSVPNRETERTTPRGYRRTPTTPTTRTLHKDRTGGDLFLFAHLTVEVSVLFIYYKSLTFV